MKKTEFQKIASMISKREGKKKSVTIGNIREVLSILMDLQKEWIDGSKESKLKNSPLSTLHICAMGKSED